MRYKVASVLFVIALCGVCIIMFSHKDIKYDIENVDVVSNISTVKEYYEASANGTKIAKFYWEGKEIDTTKKKGFYIGYSYDNNCNILKVHLTQKGHKTRIVSFVLDK